MVAVVMDNQVEKIGAFTFRKMDEPTAREIITWRYDAPYDMYNCDPKDAEETVLTFLDPQHRYCSLWDQAGALVGYCCFGEDGRVPGGGYDEEALDIGGGLRPDLTGQGLGPNFMEAALEFARRHFPPVAFRATVAAFNRRALRVCDKLGFRQVQTFESTHSGKPFVILVRGAE